MGQSNKQLAQQRLAEAARLERELQQRMERVALLKSLDCLRAVPTDELERLVDLCSFRAFLAHETIVHERNQGRFLYVLLQGSVRLTLHAKEGHEILIGVLERGDCFGEEGLFGEFFRRASARTETHCYAIQLSLSAVRALFPSSPMLQQTLRNVYMRRLTESTLARVPLFNHLSPAERLALIDLLKPQHFPRENLVVRQGDTGDAMYLIQAGHLIVKQDEQTIASLTEGDFFGELALLSHKTRNATVQAMTPVDTLVLSAADFQHLLERNPHLKDRFHHIMRQRYATESATWGNRDVGHMLTLALQHGMLRGSRLLVYAPEHCAPDCRICETACKARHGHQRLNLDGVMIGQQHVVDTCRQCQVNAECVAACPENAFDWNEKGALFITDACTGCGECIPACPYDAVARVPRTTELYGRLLKPLHKVWQLMQRTRGPVIPLETSDYTHRADKCDLCHDYTDLACVSACPTGALRLVPVEEIFPL